MSVTAELADEMSNRHEGRDGARYVFLNNMAMVAAVVLLTLGVAAFTGTAYGLWSIVLLGHLRPIKGV